MNQQSWNPINEPPCEPCAPKRESKVRMAINRLECEISGLEAACKNLSGRLELVVDKSALTAPSLKNTDSRPDCAASGVELADQIDLQGSRLRTLNLAFRRLCEVVEL